MNSLSHEEGTRVEHLSMRPYHFALGGLSWDLARMIQWTQSDLRFCKMRGEKIEETLKTGKLD